MCKGSVNAKKAVDAVHGQSLEIGVSKHGIGVFHARNVAVDDCVTCVKDGTVLTLRSIPADLQKKYQIGPMEIVRFTDQGDDTNDEIVFRKNGSDAILAEFANKGINVYVGELESVVDDDEEDDGYVESIGDLMAALPEDHFLDRTVGDARAASVYSA